jgi:hypothetical protein
LADRVWAISLPILKNRHLGILKEQQQPSSISAMSSGSLELVRTPVTEPAIKETLKPAEGATDQRLPGTQRPVADAADDEARYPVREKRRPWDRMPGEPARVFVVFLRWLSLSERTIAELHKHYPQIAQQQLAQLHDRFDWANRTERYDGWYAGVTQRNLETAEEGKAIDVSKTVRALALTASIAATRTLEVLRSEKRNRVKKDSHGNPVMKDCKTVYERNPNYIPAQRTTIDLVKASTELVRLLAGQPGSTDEIERKRQANELLKKLDVMAQSLVPRPQAPVPMNHDGDQAEVQH